MATRQAMTTRPAPNRMPSRTGQRTEFCRLVGKPAAGRAALDACKEELEVAIGDLEKGLGNRAAGVGEVRLSDRVS